MSIPGARDRAENEDFKRRKRMIDLLILQLLVLLGIGLVTVFIWHHLYRCQKLLEYIGELLRQSR